MKGGRHNVTSVEEPNAFRIARALRSSDAAESTLNGARFNFAVEYSAAPHSASSGIDPKCQPYNTHHYEPASWLTAPDFSSPSFSAHDFLQRILPRRYGTGSRPTHVPVLEDSFDADAALAALDTVESTLRKKRDISKREEEVARDELRKVLHMSAKKREQLMRTAETVSGNVGTFGDVGRHAIDALSADVASLKSAAEELARLQDARDLLSLLTMESCELDAVRVSRLLAKARRHLTDGSFAAISPLEDIAVAEVELGRCESELASSLDKWMKTAVDSGNNHVIRECASAAEELGISQSFIDSYVSYAFSPGHDKLIENRHPEWNFANLKEDEILEKFQIACWETASSINEMIPIICESFAYPSRALASILRVLSDKKVVFMAEAVLCDLLADVLSDDSKTAGRGRIETGMATNDSLRRQDIMSSDRIRTLTLSDTRNSRRDDLILTSADRRKFLNVCAEVSKMMTKLRLDLISQCQNPAAKDIESVFSEGPDPYADFAHRWITHYLSCEKVWIDEHLGTAFYDITRIEAHGPRLAPRETSSADVYHRYRTFYSRIAAQYQQMTGLAIECTYESLRRSSTILSTLPRYQQNVVPEFESVEQGTSRPHTCCPKVPRFSTGRSKSTTFQDSMDEVNNSMTQSGEDNNTVSEGSFSVRTPTNILEARMVLREILDNLVMNYLANSETILQAATHLLPAAEKDATVQELWVDGASPLTAYMQAVEVLSQSNDMLDEFLLTLEMADGISEVHGFPTEAEGDLETLVSQEMRERLHRVLISGLADLGVEAQVGVRAAVASVRARLFAMLSTPSAKTAYTAGSQSVEHFRTSMTTTNSSSDLELEPSAAYMSASSFVEQQLNSILSNVHGGNRGFVVSELCIITRETVLQCWCSCHGPVSVSGASQMIADGRAMARVCQGQKESAVIMECLPAVGQLFLESADGLWSCVESKALAIVEARILVKLLQKREDCNAERVVKVCQSLGATITELNETSAYG